MSGQELVGGVYRHKNKEANDRAEAKELDTAEQRNKDMSTQATAPSISRFYRAFVEALVEAQWILYTARCRILLNYFVVEC